MELKDITDINVAKAMAFDEIAKLETAQNNLRLLQARIAELSQTPADTSDEE